MIDLPRCNNLSPNEDLFEYGYIVKIPPVNRFKAKVRIRSIEKGKIRVILPEEFQASV